MQFHDVLETNSAFRMWLTQNHSFRVSYTQISHQSNSYSFHFLNPNLFWSKNMEKTRYEKQHIKHGKVYHAMFWIGSHMPEEAAHSFILFIQTVQVSLAMFTRFLHPRTTTHSHQLELQFILDAYIQLKRNSAAPLSHLQ